jgi:hypothetical protein
VREATRRHASTQSRSNDLGASAVEFALLLPLFLMLVFGGITGGLAVNHKIALTQAVREGARYGSTLPMPPTPTGSADDWYTAVLQATRDAAGSDFVPGQNGATMCIAFVDGASGSHTGSIRIDSTGATGGVSAGSCFDDFTGTNPARPDQRVQAVIGRDVLFDLGLLRWTVHIESESVVHYERPGP